MDTLEELLCAGTSGNNNNNNNNGGSIRDWGALNPHHQLMNTLSSKNDPHKTIYDLIKNDASKPGGACIYDLANKSDTGPSKSQTIYELMKNDPQKSSILYEVIKNESQAKTNLLYEGQTVLSSNAANLITTSLLKDGGKQSNNVDGSADSTTPPPQGTINVPDKRNPLNSIRGKFKKKFYPNCCPMATIKKS